MKRIVLAFFFFFLGVVGVSADQYSENPERYERSIDSDMFVNYIDKNTLHVIRDDSPYYIIDADIILIEYKKNVVIRQKCRFFYDTAEKTKKMMTSHLTVYDNVSGKMLADSDTDENEPALLDQRQVGGILSMHVLFLAKYLKHVDVKIE